MEPEQWLAEYDQTLARTAANAERAKESLQQVGGTASSQAGEVTVRVNASGATVDVQLTPSVRNLEPDKLARMIMETTRQAQTAVGTQVIAIMTEFVGEGPALDFVKENLPEVAVAEQDSQADSMRDYEDDREDDEYFDTPPEIIQ